MLWAKKITAVRASFDVVVAMAWGQPAVEGGVALAWWRLWLAGAMAWCVCVWECSCVALW